MTTEETLALILERLTALEARSSETHAALLEFQLELKEVRAELGRLSHRSDNQPGPEKTRRKAAAGLHPERDEDTSTLPPTD
ncbi:MAG TPA: hypothetical protein VFD58_01215 [Blastocatellia bacterium]|nr:hypothetical protein [Blastocatellia bacterium]